MNTSQLKYLTVGDEVVYNGTPMYIVEVMTESGLIQDSDTVITLSNYSSEDDDIEIFVKELF